MDNPAPIPSISPQPTVVSPAESSSRHWPLWLAGGLFMLIIGIALGAFGAKFFSQSTTQPQISTYQDCLAAKGSLVQESYPATCVTTSGQRFVQPLTDEEKQGLQPPDPYREQADSAATANWKTYTNNMCKYQVKYPPTWRLLPESETAIYGAAVIFPYEVGSGIKTPDDWLKVQISCGGVADGDSQRQTIDKLNARDSGYGVSKVESLGQTTINGKTAYKQIITAPVGDPVFEYYIFADNKSFAVIGFTPSTSKLSAKIDQILSTFHFLK